MQVRARARASLPYAGLYPTVRLMFFQRHPVRYVATKNSTHACEGRWRKRVGLMMSHRACFDPSGGRCTRPAARSDGFPPVGRGYVVEKACQMEEHCHFLRILQLHLLTKSNVLRDRGFLVLYNEVRHPRFYSRAHRSSSWPIFLLACVTRASPRLLRPWP